VFLGLKNVKTYRFIKPIFQLCLRAAKYQGSSLFPVVSL